MKLENVDVNEQKTRPGRPWLAKALMACLLAASIAVLYWCFRDYLNLEYLASVESDLKEFKDDNLLLTFGIAFAIYVAVTALSLPFATVLSLTLAWFFGFVESLLLISFASTLGATLAFLLSRYFFRDAVATMFGTRFDKLNESFEKEGPFFLFTLRLVPAFPFFLVNVLMGLTTIKTRTYWWVSQLGMLPGTAAYCFLGSQFDSLKKISEEGISLNPWLPVAFVTLGVFPLLARLTIKKLRPDAGVIQEKTK